MTTGIDFGTSNSALAACSSNGSEVQIVRFPISPVFEDKVHKKSHASYVPTLLFFPHHEPEVFTGFRAIAEYVHRGMDGRLVQSIKSFLPSISFERTAINGRTWSIEELVAQFLKDLVAEGERYLGPLRPPFILGRPAAFSADKDKDKLAEERLRTAAKMAGLDDVRFVIEPVAAALAYESQLQVNETILVGDLGGGTTDFCIMRVGPGERRRTHRRQSILASGGLHVAGDKFDASIVKEKLFPHLGYGSRYETPHGPSEVPRWLYHKLLRWNEIAFLKGRETRAFFESVERHSHSPESISALLRIVDEDLGYIMYRAVERAKRGLSVDETHPIEARDFEFPVAEVLSRSEFEAFSNDLITQIRGSLLGVMELAGVQAHQVDAVFLTGGTSHIPSVRRMFSSLFGEGKIRSGDNFTSVVDGLARSCGAEPAETI